MKSIYIVRTSISSSLLGTVTWIDSNSFLTKLKYPKKQRKKISSIRNKIRYPLNKNSVMFYGLRLTNKREPIEKIIDKIDRELKKQVDKTLSARVTMIPLDERQIRRGELEVKLCYAVTYKIVSEMGKRIITLKSENFSKRSKNAINTILDECSELNFLNNPGITKEIKNLRDLLHQPVKKVQEIVALKMLDISSEIDEKIPPRWQGVLDSIREEEEKRKKKGRRKQKKKEEG